MKMLNIQNKLTHRSHISHCCVFSLFPSWIGHWYVFFLFSSWHSFSVKIWLHSISKNLEFIKSILIRKKFINLVVINTLVAIVYILFCKIILFKFYYQYVKRHKFRVYEIYIFFGGGRGLNLQPCIYYALSISTELSSREHMRYTLKKRKPYRF